MLPLATFAQGYGDLKGFGLGGYANTDYFSRTNITAQKGAPSSKSSFLGKILSKISGKSFDDSSEDFNNTVTSQSTSQTVSQVTVAARPKQFTAEEIKQSIKNTTDKNGNFDPFACTLDPVCSSF